MNNYAALRKTIGTVVQLEGVLMLLPIVTALFYSEVSGWTFVFIALLCVTAGAIMRISSPKNTKLHSRDGFLCVALCWIVMSALGALPFTMTGSIPSYVDALFETVSGFTTTGASILTDVESLPRCMLMWRSFTHWIGGMGVLVFMLAVMPASSGASDLHLLKAESPGPSVGKMLPKLRSSAKISYEIYAVLTVVQILLLLCGGMDLFESMCMSFGTAGTGGFGILNSSCGSYTPYLQIVITVFMILFGVNFNVYFYLTLKKYRDALGSEEVRVYFGVIAVAIIAISVNIRSFFPTVGEAVRSAAFQVASIITTTGYSTADFNAWPSFSKTILVLLMFVGACAGSTGGGIKVSRIIIMWKTMLKQVRTIVHPNAVRKVMLEGKLVEHDVVRATNVFMVSYLLIMAVSTLIVSIDGFSMTTNLTSVIATINNIGPGLDVVGPAGNFSQFSVLSKLILIFDMLAGRLEIFPMLMLLSPTAWKRK